MRGINYFRLSLAVPLLVPVLAIALNLLSQFVSGSSEVTEATRWTGFLIFSLLIGGLPYLVFVGAVVLWSRGKTARAIYRLSFVSPLLFAAVFVTLWIPFVLITDASPYAFDVAFTSGGYYAVISLGLGYVYVALVHAAYLVLRRLGKVQPIAPA
jgi:hypothetical protein